MTVQTVLLGIIAPILLGSLFHIWRGGPGWRLGLYIGLAELGFWLGHFAADKLGWDFLMVGPLQMGIGILGSVVSLIMGSWLSVKQPEPEVKRKKNVTRGGRI